MKKYVGFVAALLGMVAVSTVTARPPAEFPVDRSTVSLHQATTGAALIETTGFETADGWEAGFSICGPEFDDGDCIEPQTITSCVPPGPAENCCGNYPNVDTGWFTSSASVSCTHPMISSDNPNRVKDVNSAQHLRQACDTVGGSHQAFTPIQPISTVGPTTMSFWLSGSAMNGSGLRFRAFDDDDPTNTFSAYMWFNANGKIGVTDARFPAASGGNAFVGYWAAGLYSLPVGVYRKVTIERDPCRLGANNMRYTYAVHDAVPPFNYVYNQPIIGVQSGAVERANWLQVPGTGCTNTWDIDDYEIIRGEPCPYLCGDGFVDAPETCEANNLRGCPAARCVDCQCEPACTLFDPCFLTNGQNGPFIAPFDPIFGNAAVLLYEADTESVSIETCGTEDIDTYILYWGSWYLPDPGISNDDCDTSACCGAGSDPSASCFDIGSPFYESCTCYDLIEPGDNPWVALIGSNFGFAGGSELFVTINKKSTCGVRIPGGACCDGEDGTCTYSETMDQAACDAIDAGGVFTGQAVFHAQKLCDMIECRRHTGACCDNNPKAEHCLDTFPEDCAPGPNRSWTKGVLCADAGACPALTLGACCNTLAGTCTDDETRESCGDTTPLPTDQRVFTLDTTCANTPCDAVLGACCDQDPFGGCIDTTVADCQGGKLVWRKLETCEPGLANSYECVHNSIPTVSEWGLVVLTLLLLTGAKVYFGRRQTANA